MSARIPSGDERWEEEWKEDDLEDLEPERSGGESGATATALISRDKRRILLRLMMVEFVGNGCSKAAKRWKYKVEVEKGGRKKTVRWQQAKAYDIQMQRSKFSSSPNIQGKEEEKRAG